MREAMLPLTLIHLLPTASAFLHSSVLSSPPRTYSTLKYRVVHQYNQRSNDDGPKCHVDEDAAEAKNSRRNILRNGVSWTIGGIIGTTSSRASASYKSKTVSLSGRIVDRIEPDERKIYAEALNGPGGTHKRVLWIGSGTMNGVYKNLFQTGNEVIAVDLNIPEVIDLNAATAYATEHGYQLHFEQGDATKMNFADGTFDVVVCSMFLCQDFNPEVVVSEIKRVLKPGGRFGFYEHVEDIDGIIVGRVFGERSVIRVQAYPEMVNVIGGVVVNKV